MDPKKEELSLQTLKTYGDVFVGSYKDVKGVDLDIFKHMIPMREDAKPRKLRPYTYNDTFSRKIKVEIDKVMDTKSIYKIEHIKWVSPIVAVPRNNGTLRVCVNLKQVNAATI